MYYYDRYASWGGWESQAPQETRAAYVLKNLKNRWAWKGEVVHHQIEFILKSLRAGQTVTPEENLARLTEAMRCDFKHSKAGHYWSQPKKTLGLFEHEYSKPVSDEVWKRIHDEAAECLDHFLNSGFYRELKEEDKKNWRVIEDLEEYDFEGAKVFVKLDFAREKDGVIEIYDWKTGKSDSEQAWIQLGTYVNFAMRRWNKPLSQVRIYLYNLGQQSPAPELQNIDEALLKKAEEFMRGSITEMKRLLKDPQANIPLDRSAFTYTDDMKTCDNCNFRKICGKFSV